MINIVNVYAPTARLERKTFLQLIPAFFFPNSRPLIDGGFYCYDSTLDKMGTGGFFRFEFYLFLKNHVGYEMFGVRFIREINNLHALVLIYRLPVD